MKEKLNLKKNIQLDNEQKIEFNDLIEDIESRLLKKEQEVFNYYSEIISEIKKIIDNWIHSWYEKEE